MTPDNVVLWSAPSTVFSVHLHAFGIAGITGQGRYPRGIRLSERSSRVSDLPGSPNANNINPALKYAGLIGRHREVPPSASVDGSPVKPRDFENSADFTGRTIK